VSEVRHRVEPEAYAVTPWNNEIKTLNISYTIAVALKKFGCVAAREIFPLKQHVRPAALDDPDKLIDESATTSTAGQTGRYWQGSMNDPLAQYRKKPPGVVAEPTPPKGPDEYVAFDAKDKVDRLLISSAKEQARSPGYGYLLDIAHDGPYGTNFVLYYSFMLTVLVEGKNCSR
jgi:hypothetical protein